MNLQRTVSDSFRRRADPAAFWEAWVGATLAREGLYTQHHPFVVDGDTNHGQTWDLDVSMGLINSNASVTFPFIPVEVKSLKLEFTGPLDYPYNDVLVCSQNSWNRKWPGRDYTVRDFLFVSTTSGAIVWLPAMSPVTLGHEVFDSTRGELYKAVKSGKPQLRPLQAFVDMVKDA